MGFKKAAASVAKKSGMPVKQANAVIAAGARKASPAAKKANPALKKVAAKKANPFKSMSDAACPPGSMSGGMGTSSGLGAAPKVQKAAKAAVAKKTPRAMGEVGVSTPRGRRNAVTAKTRANKKLPSQGRINPPISGKGSAKTSGSDVY